MKTKVLIVDDSSIIRTMYTKILASDPNLQVVGAAPDPYIAREMILAHKPDVMTLDIEMPRMDGLSFLEVLMKNYPVRTIVISSLSTRNSALALRALEIGAIDVMAKPALDVSAKLDAIREELVNRVKAVAGAKLPEKRLAPHADPAVHRPPVKLVRSALEQTTHQLLAIASSTGGTEALKHILPHLPADLPGTLVVQHMPPVFTRTYAESLARICPFEVKEAEEGDKVIPGRVLIAPGNFHMELKRNGAYYHVTLHQEPTLHGVRPAADYLMKSVAKYAGKNAIGVVLTGMGRDGAAGALEMKRAGAYTIAQDEASCVVFGMPREAIEAGGIDRVLPLNSIASELKRVFVDRDVIRKASGS